MLCEMTATDFSLPESRLYFLFTLFSSILSLLLSAIYLPSSLVACHEGINPSLLVMKGSGFRVVSKLEVGFRKKSSLHGTSWGCRVGGHWDTGRDLSSGKTFCFRED